jgi:hypothetical protein
VVATPGGISSLLPLDRPDGVLLQPRFLNTHNFGVRCCRPGKDSSKLAGRPQTSHVKGADGEARACSLSVRHGFSGPVSPPRQAGASDGGRQWWQRCGCAGGKW